MDSSRASKILESIDLTSRSTTPSKHYRITKLPRSTTSQAHENKAIKYFRSISKRRLRPSEPLRKGTYLPYDKASLISRIQTFTYNKWTVQSQKLTPLLVARHGWVCNKLNEIKCCTCFSSLLIKIPPLVADNDEENALILDKLFEKYTEELLRAHKSCCPWVKQISPVSVYQINDYKELDIVKHLYEWNTGQVSVLGSSPNLKLATSPLTNEEFEVVRKWCGENGLEWGDVFQCCLFGWRLEKVGNQLMLRSESCGRRVMVGVDEIDLKEEHNEWCCYVEGYKNLIRMMGNFETEQETTAEGTLERLNRLRKLYFE